ncbi:LppU/SCO3897 family protein [Micromonospora thermarum]|uniref:Uncharacterized protein n=1 Tax=Micromonospora thermarum TaxID=2720024 RepID=A0ABX0Z3B7_9ACTN|nr:hypothetical protein [Micromonospora thermarum]NJP30706.1 hypothetical protein [Micromonospora thermarum]
MTSEGTHHPGQQPDEASPGAGGPTPYGDRPAQQDNGYAVGNPDLGWAPPPPAQPNPAASAWPNEAPPTPAWAAAAQVPQQSEQSTPGAWAPDGGAPQWRAQTDQATRPETPEAPAWAQAEPPAPAWGQPNPAARGAAQVPQAWPAQDAPAHPVPGQPEAATGWSTGTAHPDPARSGGWHPGTQPDQFSSGGWATGTATQDDRPQQPEWGAPQADATGTQPEQPAWAADPAAPAWAPAARGAAQVPAAPQSWPEPDRPADAAGQSTPDASGWPAAQQDATYSGGWAADVAAPDDRRHQEDDPVRSGGWTASTQDDRPQTDWAAAGDRDTSGEPRPSDAWAGHDEQSSGGWAARAAAPAAADAGWQPAEPTSTPPARASASVSAEGAPQPWVPAQRPAAPEVEPWSPGEAWGRSELDVREPARADEPPAYQPAPGPGISPANAVPLPPQEQRVPGASLAAAPPADYAAPQFAPEQSGRDAGTPAYEGEQQDWAPAARHDESAAAPVVPAPRTSPESTGRASASVPTGGASGAVSGSASVPLASRVMPPTDQALRPTTPAPQPRVYGRPARPESTEDAEPVNGHQADQVPHRFGPEARPEHGPDNGFGPNNGYGPDNGFGPDNGYGPDNGFGRGADDRDRPVGPAAFAGAAPAVPASPAPPPPFPPGMPTFADAPAHDRPMNGVRPHGGDRPADQFGAPAAGAASVNGSGFPPPPEPAFSPAFPTVPQQAAPSWDQGGPTGQEADQGRFDSFKPIAEPAADAPVPKVRNGRVLAAVLVAAVLILAIPLGLLKLLGKIGGDEAPAFDPPVGSCVKQAGSGATAAECGEAGAFTVVSKVDAPAKCADPAQPHVVLPGEGTNRVLCLKPAA